ncbi:hypothetical protein L211DRAFT_851221 [Terfezia boudieri ATCC MYA-4762]|uniref:Uncharacterized protein n=1 Tax=Terfezia boudieri ATCC MYA-4762 TaxID=1051890 RepID=A0A3N4LUQ6_9PEZI|nr:hypothetical protein L211DRAFT_851221 [Terfezia boudieri ATCC MYA-4762]
MERLCPNFCKSSDRGGLLTVEHPDRTGDCSFGYIGTSLTETNGSTKPRGGMAVKKSFTRSTGTTTGHINGVLLDTNLSSVLLRDPIPSITSEWVAIGDGIPEVPMSAIGDSGGLLTDDDNAIVGMIIGGLRNRRVEVNGNVRLVDNLTVLTSAEELLQWIKFDLGRDEVFAGAMVPAAWNRPEIDTYELFLLHNHNISKSLYEA